MKKQTSSQIKTIKLEINFNNEDDIRILRGAQNDYSCVTRFAIKRIEEQNDIKNNDLIHIINEKFGYLDSHLINGCCQDARAMYESEIERKKDLDKKHENYKKKTGKSDKYIYKKRIFGTRKLFEQRSRNEITKDEWRLARLLPLYSIGEANKTANRKLNFDLINQQVTVKLDRNTHLSASFKIQRKNRTKELARLQELIVQKEIPVTFRISEKFLCLSFDVSKTSEEKILPISTRYAAVDLNPNGIGLSIWDGDKLLDTRFYDISSITKQSGNRTNDPKFVRMTNKKNHETIEIVCAISRLLVHYRVSKFGVEDLNFKNGNRDKGNYYNRLVNSIWNYSEVTKQLKKRCVMYGIQFKLVHAEYSSFMGNLIHKLPDPISASCELARRVNEPERRYPELPDLKELANRWKEEVRHLIESCSSWTELFGIYKNNPKMRYRIAVDKTRLRKAFSYPSGVLVL